MLYDVIAVARSRETRASTGPIRSERIDTEDNLIFQRCATPLDVEMAYESFWNDLNTRSTEIVTVLSVAAVQPRQFSEGPAKPRKK